MKDYRIFVEFPEGGFGDLRVLRFNDDDAALRFARDQILREHPACDVWNEQGRVALLRGRGDRR